MGKIYDALRRAEQKRQAGPAGWPEPTVVVDASQPVSAEPAEGLLGPARGAHRPAADPGTLRPLEVAAPTPDAVGATARATCSLVALTDPSSPAAEHLRAIRSRVLRVCEEGGHRSLLISSPGRGEGKSAVASNLALLLAAEINRRVLIVDGDLRKPSLASLFEVSRTPGLSDVALGRIPWRQAIAQAPWNGLAVLPAGARVDNASELLNGPVARQFFHEVRNAYDFVVVDAPPVLPVADAVVLAGVVDAVLLVARTGQTPREALVDAVDALAKTRLLGVVLNALPSSPLVRQGYYSY